MSWSICSLEMWRVSLGARLEQDLPNGQHPWCKKEWEHLVRRVPWQQVGWSTWTSQGWAELGRGTSTKLRKHQGAKRGGGVWAVMWTLPSERHCTCSGHVVGRYGSHSFKGTKSRFRDCPLEEAAKLSWDGERGWNGQKFLVGKFQLNKKKKNRWRMDGWLDGQTDNWIEC